MMTVAVPKTLLLSSKRAQPLDAKTGKAEEADQTSQPAFITYQTLASFSGASAVVTFLWKVLASAGGTWADRRWVPLAIAGLIGIWLTLKSFENAKTPSAYFGAILIGAVNTVQLWGAVVGLDVVLDTTAGIDQTAGAT